METEKETVQFHLCARMLTCCPEVTLDEEKVTIRDDYEGTVRLTREEAAILVEKLSEHLE